MEPGIYKDISNEEYHAAPGISCSKLKTSAKSLALYKREYIDGIRDDADSSKFVIGSAFHCAVIEADQFDDRYAVAPKVDRRTKEGKAAWQDFLDTNAGKQILSADDYATVSGMANAIKNHPVAGSFFVEGEAEVSFFVRDEPTGLMKKCRVDWMSKLVRFDLKSTTDASKDAFSRAMFNLKYYVQAAYYTDIINELTGQDVEDFVFVAVEKSPPYLVGIYMIDAASLEIGRREYRDLLDRLAYWQERNLYPGYNNDDATVISLPPWASGKIEHIIDSNEW